MQIKMLTGMAGSEYVLSPGDVHTFPDAEAERLIAAGFAERVATRKREKAVKPSVETRVAD